MFYETMLIINRVVKTKAFSIKKIVSVSNKKLMLMAFRLAPTD